MKMWKKWVAGLTLLFVCLVISGLPVPVLANVVTKPSDLLGTWSGSYMGNVSGSLVERNIKLNIDSVEMSGAFSGLAEIDHGKASYFFEGKINIETGSFSFKGKRWKVNPDRWSFLSFNGEYNRSEKTMEGTVESSSSRPFSLKKVSDDYESLRVPAVLVPRDWSGEYDGHRDSTVVRRNMEFHITDITDGEVKGTILISPSDKAAENLGVTGSYYFKGTYDERTAYFVCQGYEWIQYPIGEYVTNFTFIKFNGYLSSDRKAISGTTEYGIWEMKPIDYQEEPVVDSGFQLKRDNNNFSHTSSSKASNPGFLGITGYPLSDNYYARLTCDATDSEKNAIKKKMADEWGGSCYGIAATMGLLYEKKITMDDLSSGGSNYYSMELPYKDQKLLNSINYYQLSQNIAKYSKSEASNAISHQRSNFEKLINWNSKNESLSVCLKSMVADAKKGHVLQLCYLYDHDGKTSGHAILIVGYEYRSDTDDFRLKLYDENGRSDFIYMTVSKDYTQFSFTDANGMVINQDTYISIYYLDYSKLDTILWKSNLSRSGADDANASYIVFGVGKPFELVTSDGSTLIYDGKNLSGSLRINEVDYMLEDETLSMKITTSKISGFELTGINSGVDIEIYDADNFKAIEGEKIQTIKGEVAGDVQLSGSQFQFKVYSSVDEKNAAEEKGLASISATASGDVNVEKGSSTVSASSENELTDIEVGIYTGTNRQTTPVEDDQKEVSVDALEEITPDDNTKTKDITKATVKLSKTSYVYNGKAKKPGITVEMGTKTLKKGSDFTVAYTNNVKVGKATVTVTGTGQYSGKIKKTFTIVPKGTTIRKLTTKSRSVTITWTKQTKQTTGYQVQSSTSKKFTKKTTKTKTIKKNKTVKVTIKSLKAGKKYYLRVRTYRKVNGKNYYSAWSKTKAIKVKK